MQTCPVTQSLNAHLARVEAAEIASEQADERQKELLSSSGSCYPFDQDNLSEAIYQIEIDLLAKALQAGDYEAAGRALASEVTQFWGKEARAIAKATYQ